MTRTILAGMASVALLTAAGGPAPAQQAEERPYTIKEAVSASADGLVLYGGSDIFGLANLANSLRSDDYNVYVLDGPDANKDIALAYIAGRGPLELTQDMLLGYADDLAAAYDALLGAPESGSGEQP